MAKSIPQKFGDVSVLIISTDESIPDPPANEGIQKTSVGKPLEHVWEVVKEVASDLGKRFSDLKQAMPNEVEVEFGLTFSEKVNLWAIKGDSSQAIKVKLKWNK